ncbi:RNA-binding domain-containing protein [Marasmius fiardii PR-910]|nr:RNA-binding domain-containing protein [Marasmius fiardii PR-910]
MSELDADIYGDLYGTDATDQQTEEEPQPAAEPTKTETSGTASTQPPSSTANPIEPGKPAHIGTTSGSIGSSVAYTQQIPTYEEPLENRIPRPLGGYQNNPMTASRPSDLKEDGKMFVGGLNWDTTDEGLRDYFSQFGVVDACSIMRDPAGRSRCFAFLTFRDAESVDKVVAQQEHIVDGKIIDPKRAIPRHEHQKATKLFIGGLPGSVNSESMREFFSQYGRVVESTVMLDQQTGRSKGFGFVSFEDTDVKPFLGFGNLAIDGKLIDVKLAQPRYQREANEQEGGGGSGNYNNANRVAGSSAGMGGGYGGFNNNNTGGNFAGGGGQGNAPFDPQALAALYTRMFQMANGNMNMMGGMNPHMGLMGNGGMGSGMMGNMGHGGMGSGMGGGMGRGGMQGAHIPKGPRGGPPNGGGPQRAGQRGHHGYHPYSR